MLSNEVPDEEDSTDDWDDVEQMLPYIYKSSDGHISMNVDTLSTLSVIKRRKLIEIVRHQNRAKNRQNFLPVADDPALYSQTQMSNFLRSRYSTAFL